jgi:hypothetical protein
MNAPETPAATTPTDIRAAAHQDASEIYAVACRLKGLAKSIANEIENADGDVLHMLSGVAKDASDRLNDIAERLEGVRQ